jgi:UDP-N-acetylmuramoylalanine--D-glutamate ligase
MVNNWSNKKVLVMGLGLHGGAFQVAKWLLKQNAIITITDLRSAAVLRPTLDKIKRLPKSGQITYILGKHRLADFKDQDLIVQNPGVPPNSKYLVAARKLNIPIVNEAVMFFGLYSSNIIGVTGTRGKSTTTTLLHQILKTTIKDNVVAGNIGTTPMFAVLDKLSKKSLPVVELSSWHLEGLADYKRSPHIAVITNILVDHLNRYKNFAAYKQAKIHIIKNQKQTDIAILNADNKHTKDLAKYTKAKVYYFSLHKKVKGVYLKNNHFYFYNNKKESEILSTNDVKLLGEHGLSNAAAAICVAKLVGISNAKIKQAVSRFKGIDYRLQSLGYWKNIEIFNDATASTPDAAIAAIQALSQRNVLLIAGGEDKKLDYKFLAKAIKKQIKALILLKGSGSQKLLAELKKIKYQPQILIKDVASLQAAWQYAKKNSQDHEVILFSPAAASFNMFVNEFERARVFESLVKNG